MNDMTRFAELRQLVSIIAPTREEARYLKVLLSAVHTDLIGELPVELVVIIAVQLKLDDFAACLRVSKVWREKFLSDSVMTAFGIRSCPALIDSVATRQDFQRTFSKLGWASYSFGRHCYRLSSELVQYDRRANIQLDQEFHSRADRIPAVYLRHPLDVLHEPVHLPPSPKFYSSGKAAWHLCDHVVVVDDLRSKKRKVFTPPSGMMHGLTLKLQALGSRLVIGTIDRLLIAWDHIDNQALEKSLPCRALRCTTQGEKVAIVLSGGDVLIWTFGKAMLQLDTSAVILELGIDPYEIRTWKASLNVFFDPRSSKTSYLASAYTRYVHSTNVLRTTVHEFAMADLVASWTSSESPYFVHSSSRIPVEDAGEPPIVISDYECERGCIFFRRRDRRIMANEPLLVFDKTKREFSRFQTCPLNVEISDHRLIKVFADLFLRSFEVQGGFDQDFLVSFNHNGYEVKRVCSERLPFEPR